MYMGSNRETWLVQIWYNLKQKEDLVFTKKIIEEEHAAMPNGLFKDLINLKAIEWKELEDALDP